MMSALITINKQPDHTCVEEGAALQLSVQAAGGFPGEALNYEWTHNGAVIESQRSAVLRMPHPGRLRLLARAVRQVMCRQMESLKTQQRRSQGISRTAITMVPLCFFRMHMYIRSPFVSLRSGNWVRMPDATASFNIYAYCSIGHGTAALEIAVLRTALEHPRIPPA